MSRIPHFKFWVQKTFPAIYDDSLSYYELLSRVIAQLNSVIEQTNGINDFVNESIEWLLGDGLTSAVSDKLDKYVLDGTLDHLLTESVLRNGLIEIDSLNEISELSSGFTGKIGATLNIENEVVLENININLIDFASDNTISFNNNLDWNDRNWSGSAWSYITKDAIVLNGLKDVVIKNMHLVGNRDTSNKMWNGLVLKNCINVTIENALVEKFNWCAISIENTCRDVKILNTKVDDSRYGIYDKGSRTVVDGCYITNSFSISEEFKTNGSWLKPTAEFDSKYYDGLMAFGVNSRYTNNLCVDNGQSGIYSSSMQNCIISDNQVISNFNVGIDLGTVNGTNGILNATIVNNDVRYNKRNDVNLTGVAYSILADNFIHTTAPNQFSIILTSVSANNTIMGNKVLNTGGGEINLQRGVSIANTCLNNKVLMNDVEAPTPYYISGNTTTLVTHEPSNYKKTLDVTLDEGRKAITLNPASGETATEIISSQPILFNTPVGQRQNISAASVETQGITTTGLMYFTNTGELSLPTTSRNASGRIWLDTNTGEIMFCPQPGVVKQISSSIV